jgi:hypothetical protein
MGLPRIQHDIAGISWDMFDILRWVAVGVVEKYVKRHPEGVITYVSSKPCLPEGNGYNHRISNPSKVWEMGTLFHYLLDLFVCN